MANTDKTGPGEYHVILGLRQFELPNRDYEFRSKYFSVLPCPNRLVPNANSSQEEPDWEVPERIDDHYPTCEFFMDIPFKTNKPLEHSEVYELGKDRALWITSLLRLHQTGYLFTYVYDITGPGISRGLRRGPFILLAFHQNPRAPRYSPYYLDNVEDVNKMSTFVDKYISIDWLPIRLALERLSAYYKREWSPDLIIDLMIILESLFTYGHENISYQVRLKTAAFLKGTDETSRLHRTPEDIYKFVKDAYDNRSHIIHGGDKAEKWMHGEFTSENRTRHNVDELEEIARSCLRETLNWINQGKSISPGDLDKQLFLT